MSRIKDENYFQVSGWMINHLQLKGNELMVFAIIYGFTQAENQQYTGSRKYIADFIGCSVGTVDNCLSGLVKKGLLEKSESITNGVKFCAYSVNCATATKIVPPPTKNCATPTTTKIVHNNKQTNVCEDYLNNNINNNPAPADAYTEDEKKKMQETAAVVKKEYPRCNYPIPTARATLAAVKRIAKEREIDIIAACEYLQQRVRLYAECKYGEDRQYLPEAHNWLDDGGYDADEKNWSRGTGNEQPYKPKNF